MGNVTVRQVPLSWESLNMGDSFVLDSGSPVEGEGVPPGRTDGMLLLLASCSTQCVCWVARRWATLSLQVATAVVIHTPDFRWFGRLSSANLQTHLCNSPLQPLHASSHAVKIHMPRVLEMVCVCACNAQPLLFSLEYPLRCVGSALHWPHYPAPDELGAGTVGLVRCAPVARSC
jgi:hypothetical protein